MREESRNQPAFDEEGQGHLAIQLRGLPYKATVEDVQSPKALIACDLEDIRNFLGTYIEKLHARAAAESFIGVKGQQPNPFGGAALSAVRLASLEHLYKLYKPREVATQLNRDGRPSGFARVVFDSEEESSERPSEPLWRSPRVKLAMNCIFVAWKIATSRPCFMCRFGIEL